MQARNQERPTISIVNDIKLIVVRFGVDLYAKTYRYVLNERRYDYQKDSNDPILSIYERKLEEIISLEKKLDYLYMLVENLSKKRPELYIAEWVDKKIKQVEAELLSQEFMADIGSADEVIVETDALVNENLQSAQCVALCRELGLTLENQKINKLLAILTRKSPSSFNNYWSKREDENKSMKKAFEWARKQIAELKE